MSRTARITLSVDPDTIHVDDDGCLVVDTSTVWLLMPMTADGIRLLADRLLQWLADHDQPMPVDVGPVGHIDDTPAVRIGSGQTLPKGDGGWYTINADITPPSAVELPADVRAELADTVRRGVLNVEYRLTPPGAARFQSREDHEDAIGARLNNADGPDAA